MSEKVGYRLSAFTAVLLCSEAMTIAFSIGGVGASAGKQGVEFVFEGLHTEIVKKGFNVVLKHLAWGFIITVGRDRQQWVPRVPWATRANVTVYIKLHYYFKGKE